MFLVLFLLRSKDDESITMRSRNLLECLGTNSTLSTVRPRSKGTFDRRAIFSFLFLLCNTLQRDIVAQMVGCTALTQISRRLKSYKATYWGNIDVFSESKRTANDDLLPNWLAL